MKDKHKAPDETTRKPGAGKPSRRTKLFCSECGYQFPPDLVELVNRGEPCYCERCGTQLNIQPTSPAGSAAGTGARRDGPSREPRARDPVPRDHDDHDDHDHDHGQYIRRGIYHEAETYHKPYEELLAKKRAKRLARLDRAIQGVNNASLALGALLLSLGTLALVFMVPFTRAFDPDFSYRLVILVSQPLFGVLALVHDARHFIPELRQRDYSSRGIPQIILGIVGCIGFGAGALIIVKGALVLARTQKDPVEQRVPKRQWLTNVIRDLNGFAWQLPALVLVPTTGILVVNLVSGTLQQTIIAICFATIALVVDYLVYRPKIAQAEPANADGAIVLFVGILGCVAYGAGLLIVVKGLLLLAYPASDAPAKHPPASEKSRRARLAGDQAPREIPYRPSSSLTPPPRPAIPSSALSPPETPQESPQEAPREAQRERPREAPEQPPHEPASKPLPRIPKVTPRATPGAPPGAIPQQSSTESPRDPSPAGTSGLSPDDQAIMKVYLNRVFTVLSAKIRGRVRALNIPEAQKAEILKEFVYLSEAEQDEFLAEFEALNERVPPQLVARVLKLDLSKPQKQRLVDQLEYLSPEEQLEFVVELEKATHLS